MAASVNKVERLELKDQFKHTLEEARIVLPGIQAIFGFQLIAVFNQQFAKSLDPTEQKLHFLATALLALAAMLAMTPSALHREGQPDCVSTRLVRLATLCLTGAMVPLSIGLSIDLALLAKIIFQDAMLARILGASLLALAVLLWYVIPNVLRRYLNERTDDIQIQREPS